MTESLWTASADDLLQRTASADPTPGGGSVAAISGALGVALVQMALAVTDDPALADHGTRLAALRETVAAAADRDVADFTALMAAYRLPRDDDRQRAHRTERIKEASITATDSPLRLAEALVEAVAISREVEPLVKASIVSDVLAGRDLALGAARAAVRTADINLAQLRRSSSPALPDLQARRTAVLAALEDAS